MGNDCFMAIGFLFVGDENVLNLDCSDSCIYL